MLLGLGLNALIVTVRYEQADHAAVQVGNFQMSGSCR
jgi:hypothetical protein